MDKNSYFARVRHDPFGAFHGFIKICIDGIVFQVSPSRWKMVFGFWKLKGKYHGCRCFIIGNGPSLKQTDLTLLKKEYTFGLNRIYLLSDETGFRPTFMVSVNRVLLEQFGKEIEALPTPKFLSWQARKWVDLQDGDLFVRDSGFHPLKPLGFSKRPWAKIWEGATVTYVAMQLAYYLGFDEVILIGVDHSFTTKGTPHKEIVSESEDPNHFHPEYFGKGVRWQLPDLETSERAYLLAKETFEQYGRRIIDATINGKLKVFKKIDYNTLFSNDPDA